MRDPVKKSMADDSRRTRQERQTAKADAPEVEHDDECGDQIRYGGCCKHYCATGEHEVMTA